MQHLQSYLLLSTRYIFSASHHFISFPIFPQNNSSIQLLYKFFLSSYTRILLIYQEQYNTIVQKKKKESIFQISLHFPPKFHPRPSSADYNREGGIGEEEARPPNGGKNTRSESTISERKETSRAESRRSVVHVHHL